MIREIMTINERKEAIEYRAELEKLAKEEEEELLETSLAKSSVYNSLSPNKNFLSPSPNRRPGGMSPDRRVNNSSFMGGDARSTGGASDFRSFNVKLHKVGGGGGVRSSYGGEGTPMAGRRESVAVTNFASGSPAAAAAPPKTSAKRSNVGDRLSVTERSQKSDNYESKTLEDLEKLKNEVFVQMR